MENAVRLLLLASMGAASLAQAPGRQVVETVVAKVNDEIITETSFYRSFALIKKALEEKYADKPQELMEALKSRRWAFLETMIDNLLLTQKARRDGIKVSEDEIREVIDRLMLENGIKTQEEFVLALRSEGLDFEDFKTDLRSQGYREKLVQQEILRKIAVAESEVKAYYEENPDRFSVPPGAWIREIGMGSDRRQAEELMAKVKARLQAGEAFEKVASEVSLSASREKGGDLGWFSKGDLDPAIEAAILGLRPGQVSGLVESAYGFHVIELEQRREAGRRPFEEAKEEIADVLRKKKYDDDLKALVSKLREEADIRYKNDKGILVEAKALPKTEGSS